MAEAIRNPNAYRFGPASKTVKVTFEIALDMVPGWGKDVVDHINLVFRADPYALSATIVEE